jgi:hypothetical protein
MGDRERESDDSEPPTQPPTRNELLIRVQSSLASIEDCISDLRFVVNTLNEEFEEISAIVQSLMENPDDEHPPPTNQRASWTGEIDNVYLSGAHIDARRLRGIIPEHVDGIRRLIAWNDLSQEERDRILSREFGVDSDRRASDRRA